MHPVLRTALQRALLAAVEYLAAEAVSYATRRLR